MQRYSNLDMAEIQTANINELINDVAALLEPYEGKVKVEMDLHAVPPLVCRPQQLSAVFSNLMGNAIDATNGDGRVVVSSREKDSAVEVAFADNGRGLNPQELETIFDPGFKVSHGRVAYRKLEHVQLPPDRPRARGRHPDRERTRQRHMRSRLSSRKRHVRQRV